MSKPLKIVLWVVGIAVAVVVLFTTVFPWVEERTQDPTLGSGTPVAEVARDSVEVLPGRDGQRQAV